MCTWEEEGSDGRKQQNPESAACKSRVGPTNREKWKKFRSECRQRGDQCAFYILGRNACDALHIWRASQEIEKNIFKPYVILQNPFQPKNLENLPRISIISKKGTVDAPKSDKLE